MYQPCLTSASCIVSLLLYCNQLCQVLFSLQSCPSSYSAKHYNEPYNSRGRGFAARASADSNDAFVTTPPLQFESSVGQLLEQILQTHPHLLLATIDQQLQKLQTARDTDKEESPTSSQDSLYK